MRITSAQYLVDLNELAAICNLAELRMADCNKLQKLKEIDVRDSSFKDEDDIYLPAGCITIKD